MFQGCFKEVSKKFQVPKVSKVFQECFNDVLFCDLVVAWILSKLPEQKESLFIVVHMGSKHPIGPVHALHSVHKVCTSFKWGGRFAKKFSCQSQLQLRLILRWVVTIFPPPHRAATLPSKQ